MAGRKLLSRKCCATGACLAAHGPGRALHVRTRCCTVGKHCRQKQAAHQPTSPPPHLVCKRNLLNGLHSVMGAQCMRCVCCVCCVTRTGHKQVRHWRCGTALWYLHKHPTHTSNCAPHSPPLLASPRPGAGPRASRPPQSRWRRGGSGPGGQARLNRHMCVGAQASCLRSMMERAIGRHNKHLPLRARHPPPTHLDVLIHEKCLRDRGRVSQARGLNLQACVHIWVLSSCSSYWVPVTWAHAHALHSLAATHQHSIEALAVSALLAEPGENLDEVAAHCSSNQAQHVMRGCGFTQLTAWWTSRWVLCMSTAVHCCSCSSCS